MVSDVRHTFQNRKVFRIVKLTDFPKPPNGFIMNFIWFDTQQIFDIH